MEQRKIIFRSYDTVNKKMYGVITDIHWQISGKVQGCKYMVSEIDDGVLRNGISPEKENFVLLQYTGLKDKKGREIYEGDIVIWEACSCEVRFGFHTVTVDDSGNKESSAYGFYLYFYGMKCDEPIDRNVEGNCEVIGNIYENPELIK